MQKPQAEPSLANATLTDNDNVMEAADDRLRQAMIDVIRSDAVRGIADDVAV